MVGTFYSRPSPDEPEFVSVGTQVEIGTPVCIIEVTKLFTTIESTKAGTVKAILAEDGQLVDYGQALFVID
ncbi:Biotin-requiring enzyme [Roseovarius lutimaris]|uniref:Biotin-requiring enzyme n=2 Tax=Roseovarius lutimaris TaxID=1005928 RepID=A0A1I5F2C2_9RHOB|nr:Biotin-requiring enzyme [Roseovarius lutimaris]